MTRPNLFVMALSQTFSMIRLTPLAVHSARAKTVTNFNHVFHVITVRASPFSILFLGEYDSNCVTAYNLSKPNKSNINGR